MLLLFLVVLISLSIILIFASPKLSPIPYFPSNRHDLPLIIKALNLQNNQTIIDLGAGDGIVIFKAAQEALDKKLNTKFIAIDINPILVLIMKIHRFFHPNKKNIQIIRGNFFKMNLSLLTANSYPLTTYYLYISPWLLEKTLSIIKLAPGKKSIVSYFYPIKSLKPNNHVKGVNNLYTYKI